MARACSPTAQGEDSCLGGSGLLLPWWGGLQGGGLAVWALGPVGPVCRRDVTWLAGYPHPRHHGGRLLAAALQEAFAEPAPLWEGVCRTGDPLIVLPALFHALWAGRLRAALGAPMHEWMPVWAQAAG